MKSVEILTKEDLCSVMDEIKHLSIKLDNMMGLNGALVFSNDSLSGHLGVSKRTLQSYRDTGKINYSKVDRLIFYRREDVDNFLITNSNAPYQQEQRRNKFIRQSKNI